MSGEFWFDYRDWDPRRLQAAFAEYGLVVVRGSVERDRADALAAALKRLMTARLEASGVEVEDRSDLDRLYAQLAAREPDDVGRLFVLVRQLVEHAQLIFSPQVLDVVRALIPNTVLQVIPEACGLRIDPGGDATRSFGWHHDYSFLAMSRNGVTGWTPLTPLDDSMGWIRVVPGSHKTITPVIFHETFAQRGEFRGHQAFELRRDERALESSGVDIAGVQPGDLFVIHSCLLHRSGANTSNRARWTVLPRYGDALDAAVVARGWQAIRGATAPRLFNELHPDLVEVRPAR